MIVGGYGMICECLKNHIHSCKNLLHGCLLNARAQFLDTLLFLSTNACSGRYPEKSLCPATRDFVSARAPPSPIWLLANWIHCNAGQPPLKNACANAFAPVSRIKLHCKSSLRSLGHPPSRSELPMALTAPHPNWFARKINSNKSGQHALFAKARERAHAPLYRILLYAK